MEEGRVYSKDWIHKRIQADLDGKLTNPRLAPKLQAADRDNRSRIKELMKLEEKGKLPKVTPLPARSDSGGSKDWHQLPEEKLAGFKKDKTPAKMERDIKRQSFDRKLEEFVRRSRDGRVRALARKAVAQNEEDIFQEACVKSLKYWRSFKPDTMDFDAWFNGILINAASDSNNAERRQGMTQIPNDFDVTFVNIDDLRHLRNTVDMDELALVGEIKWRMGTWKDGAAKILYATLILGLTVREAAERLGVAKSAVDREVNGFKTYMKQVLEGPEEAQDKPIGQLVDTRPSLLKARRELRQLLEEQGVGHLYSEVMRRPMRTKSSRVRKIR